MHLVEDIEIIKKDNKYGLKNNIKGQIILEPIYDLIEKWEHSDSYYFVSNPDEEPDIPDMYVIIKNHKIGFADGNGIVVEPIYDDILDEQFVYREKLYPAFVAKKDKKYGYIDKYGKQLTEFIYKDIQFPLNSPIAHVLNQNGKEEFINVCTGKTFLSCKPEKQIISSVAGNHLAMLIDDKRYKIFDLDGNCIVDFLNNKELNSAPIRYLNEKLLMYFTETEVGSSMYKVGLINYSGKILTDAKYSHIQAITGTTCVLGTNLVGSLNELIDENGKVLLSKMKNAISWEGEDNEGRLISPISYWKEDDDPTDIDKCIQVDENLISSKEKSENSDKTE